MLLRNQSENSLSMMKPEYLDFETSFWSFFVRFVINSTSGEILLNSKLDYEEESSIVLTVVATDDADIYPNTATITVTINVNDVNDNVPVVTNLPNEVEVEENVDSVVVFTIKVRFSHISLIYIDADKKIFLHQVNYIESNFII